MLAKLSRYENARTEKKNNNVKNVKARVSVKTSFSLAEYQQFRFHRFEFNNCQNNRFFRLSFSYHKFQCLWILDYWNNIVRHHTNTVRSQLQFLFFICQFFCPFSFWNENKGSRDSTKLRKNEMKQESK